MHNTYIRTYIRSTAYHHKRSLIPLFYSSRRILGLATREEEATENNRAIKFNFQQRQEKNILMIQCIIFITEEAIILL